MGKIKEGKIRIAQFSNISIDEIVDAHIEFVTTPITRVANWQEITCDENCAMPKLEVTKNAKKAPRKAVLCHKYIFLLHLIIIRCRTNKENRIRVEYKILTSILGDCYGDMLYNLKKMRIIDMETAYTPSKKSRGISLLNWSIEFLESKNLKVIEYIHKYEKCKNKLEQEYFKNTKKDEFVTKYNESLSCLDLTKRDKAIEYIHSRKYSSSHSYHFYLSRIEDFNKDELRVVSVDNNNRIYHYFTNLPKVLKPFYNIKYQLDISNSHPLLFSYYLIKYYKINNDILDCLYNLSITEYDNNKDHNVSKQLCNMLNVKKIGVSNDVLKYIYVTSKGKFWDDFVETFGSMNRGEVKATLFKEVFYSHSTTTRNKDFAKIFVKQYPNVWKVIRNMKKSDKLPHLMMRFESRLFRRILTECYNRGWKVVSIHDAIVVPSIEENNYINMDELKALMIEVYKSYNLNPNVSVDVYGEKA
ncbi:hypothetical protein [Bacteroides sp. 224]|uniref:hypothetical protein n=1 Tax=Bacteroides sp. 224 TaxID=2302936 RepID=UPI0013D6F847|nr:hypothetical protein [Bacteroides sp. 224]NDV66403.1 hypothetical protein [Bacteroides sp. 224]